MMQRFLQFPSSIPPNAVILNMGLCEICQQPYLLDSSESPVCGRAKCIAARIVWGITMASKLDHGQDATGPEWWQKAVAIERAQRLREHERRSAAAYSGSTADLVKKRRHGGYARSMNTNELTAKEISILQGCADGYTYKVIAEHIGTSEQVIKNCTKGIFDKLGCDGMTRAVVIALGRGLIKGAEQTV